MRYGEGRAGSPGYRVQTFIEEASPFSLRWQAQDGAPWVEFARHTVEVVGAEPARLVVSAPSRVAPASRSSCMCASRTVGAIRRDLDAPLQIELADGGLEAIACNAVDVAALRVDACARSRFGVPASQRVEARTLGTPALRARSNPIRGVRAAAGRSRCSGATCTRSR